MNSFIHSSGAYPGASTGCETMNWIHESINELDLESIARHHAHSHNTSTHSLTTKGDLEQS